MGREKLEIWLVYPWKSGRRDPDGSIRIFYIPIDNGSQQYVREYDRKILQEGAKKSFCLKDKKYRNT